MTAPALNTDALNTGPLTSLARSRITGRPVAATSALAVAAPVQAAGRGAALPPQLRQFIRPQAASRWILPQLSAITPTYIEQTLRGAFNGSNIQQWELFDLMEDTWPRLAKNLNEIKRAVLSRHRRFEPWTEEDQPVTESAKERSRLVANALWRMTPDPAEDENDFEATIYDLLDALGKGVSVLEILWEIREAGSLGQIMAPRATKWVQPQCYAWSNEGRLGLNPHAIDGTAKSRQRGYIAGPSYGYGQPQDLVEMPPDKFLVAVSKAKTGHPLCSALLRPLSWWWCAANFSADWLMNYAQLFGLPIRLGFYDSSASADTVSEIATMLEDMGSASWGAFPVGTQIELRESTKTGNSLPQGDLLDRADKNCDLIILGQTLTSDTGGMGAGGGSLALGQVHSGVKEQHVESAACWVASIINKQFIPAVLRQNYGDESEPPEVILEAGESPEAAQLQLKTSTETYNMAVTAGLVTPHLADEEHFRKMAKLPAISPEIEEAWREKPTRGPSTMPAPAFGFPRQPQPPAPEEQETEEEDEEKAAAAVQAKAATDALIDRTLEDLTGVQARWLGALRNPIHTLIALAEAQSVSDADFLRAAETMSREIPDLFKRMNKEALATHLRDAMGAAVVNGAVQGALDRKRRDA